MLAPPVACGRDSFTGGGCRRWTGFPVRLQRPDDSPVLSVLRLSAATRLQNGLQTGMLSGWEMEKRGICGNEEKSFSGEAAKARQQASVIR